MNTMAKEKLYRHAGKISNSYKILKGSASLISPPSKFSSMVCLTDYETLYDSDVDPEIPSGRVTPIPADMFSDEELTERLTDGSKSAKKTTKRPKSKKPMLNAELTDFECLSASEHEPDDSSYEFDFEGMPVNFRITSRDSIKPLLDSSSEDEKHVRRRVSGGVSGVSDLEVTSEDEIDRHGNKLAVEMIYKSNTDVEDLSGDERQQPQNRKRQLENRRRMATSPTSQLLEAMASSGLRTITPGKADVTDEEDFSEGSQSEPEPVSPGRVLTPVKDLDYCGVVTEKIRKLPPSDSSTVPKIVVSYFENEEKAASGKISNLKSATAKQPFKHTSGNVKQKTSNTKENATCKNLNKQSKICKRTTTEDKLQPAVYQGEPSDSESTFLTPKSAEKKKKKSKKIKKRKEIGETDVEELGNSDREMDLGQQQTKGLIDLEDGGFQSDSEMEDERKGGTEAEDFETSTEDEKSVTSQSSGSVIYEESVVHIENRMQSNWDSPEELIHRKNYEELAEVHTDVENVDLPEGEKPKKPLKKQRNCSRFFENEGLNSKSSNISSFVRSGGSCRRSERGRICSWEQKQRKCNKDVRKTKEWSEKGQSEEYAYETKGIISEPEPTAEARQPADKSKSGRDTKEDKSEGVKFYELDDKEEFVATGNDPVPEVTMPSFKKRVHSQRIPQRERPAVTPYEGSYDEKYSSDEENLEYDVYEPEDITERSNSTVTFSEDIYDSDAIDEMIRSQMRKASVQSQEGCVREDMTDGGKPTKSILKDGKGRGSKKDGAATRPTDLPMAPVQGKITQIIVSPPDAVPEGGAKIQEAATSGVNKIDEKGEKLVEDVTKPLQDITTDTVTDKETWVKGEREVVTKSPQSTIPRQIDQITDSSATNKHDFAKNDEKLLENQSKPQQDTQTKQSEKPFQQQTPTETGSAKTGADKTEQTPEVLPKEKTIIEKADVSHSEEADGSLSKVADLTPASFNIKPERFSSETAVAQKDFTKVVEIPVSSVQSSEESAIKQTASPTKEEAAETAKQLIEDITKTVQDVFPEIPIKSAATKPEETTTTDKSKPTDWKTQNGGTKQLESVAISDTVPTTASIKTEPVAKPDTIKPQKEEVKLESKPIHQTEVVETVKVSEEISKKPEITETTEKVSVPEKPAEKSPPSGDKVANGVAKMLPPEKETVTEVSEKSIPAPKPATEDTVPKPSTEKETKRDEKTSISAKDKQGSVLSDTKPADILVVETSDKALTKPDEKPRPGVDSGAERPVESLQTAEQLVEATSEMPIAAEARDKVPKLEKTDSTESKPRVIFRIDSEDDLHSEADSEGIPPFSPTHELMERSKRELKEMLEKDQMKIEERLTSMKGRIFDISDESLLKTKELVDERLRKISEIKPPQEIEEPFKKEKSPARGEEIKIGRFHITPALVEEVVSRSKEHEIAERLKTTRTDEETHDEVEKELPEKLTEADLEEVIRELKKEGLKTDVYLQPEDKEKEEKKEKTLRRVERRFERMASETLEKEKEEEGVSEEKLNEKREIEFQRMISNLSSEEVAEYQQEYLQLWDEGGLSSLTPTDDWESRDPDTPENELDDDTPRKSESFRGSHGTGETGEPTKSSDPKKSLKSPTSPPKPVRFSNDISPKAQPLTPIDLSHVGSSPSEIDQSSGFVSERSDDIPTYGDRKKFWEQMSSSQSSETASELPRSMVESVSSVESVEIDRLPRNVEEPEKISVKAAKQKFEKEAAEVVKAPEEGGFVKSLTESYSKKIAAGELIMPAIPRPKSSTSKDSLVYEAQQTEILKFPDSSDTAVVSELEVKLKSRDPSAPITDHTVVPGSTKPETQTKDKDEFPKPKKIGKDISSDKSTDSEAEFISRYGHESVAYDNRVFSDEDVNIPLSERRKVFEEAIQTPSVVPARKPDRSMSLPTAELPLGVKSKKQYFEEEMKKEMIVEQIMKQVEEVPEEVEEKKPGEKKKTPEIEEAATTAMTELLVKGVKIAEKTLRSKEKKLEKETHEEKSEIEGNEKEKTVEPKKPKQKEEEFIPSITVTTTGKRQTETASIGESEDTQSESDVTPEEGRVVDNGDTQWDGTQSGGFSPKDDIDYPKEVRETGIGRWIGQEDLSKPSWEKDDLDSSHYKIQTKWERTRSEGGSPKEHYVCTPEEHYPDTVWEVPVQEQLEKEEITHDIPIEKQVIIEKDEEEYEEEEESKTKLTEEEAKGIAEEILEYIQFEVENRSSFLINEDETPEGITQAQVTDYLRHLTGGKEFDEQDVQLIESILARKQKGQFWKSQSVDTAACSVDITDEELRSTGLENDSPVESQMTKLQSLEEEDFYKTEIEDDVKPSHDAQRLKDAEIVDQTIAEVKESLEAAQEQLIEQHKKKMKSEVLKKESPSEFEFKGISYDRKLTEPIPEPDYETTTEMKKTEREKISDTQQKHSETVKKVTGDEKTEKKTEESLSQQISMKKSHQEELILADLEKEKVEKRLSKDSSDEEKKLFESQQIQTKMEKPGAAQSDRRSIEKTDFDKTSKTTEELMEKVETGDNIKQQFGLQTEDRQIQQTEEKETLEKESVIQKGSEKIQRSSTEEKEKLQDSLRESGKTETKIIEKDSTGLRSSSKKTEISISDSKSVVVETKTDNEQFKTLEISVPESVVSRKMGEHVYSSEDSPRSTSLEDSAKSPPGGEEIPSSASSVDKPGDYKPDVVLRQSTTSTHLKTDRRSGADLEPYSSSGESHYHSFEHTPSRPCSSDVEGLLAGNVGTTGSSEYESAMSHEISSKQPTLTDYHTAVSSLSSRESIKSLDSESSGHLASVEVSSEASETLIPSALELEGVLEDDGLDMDRAKAQPPAYRTQMSAPAGVNRPVDEDFEIISESEVASWTAGVSEDEDAVVVTAEDVISSEENAQKMKRSHEMTFQPEPKPIVFSDSLDTFSKDSAAERLPGTDETSSVISAPDEKFGSSLEESGSVLSMSLSTTSDVRTVIELSHTDSEKMDGSLTVSATSLESREDVEAAQPQSVTNEMSTSTPVSGLRKKTESVTITTSSSDDHGVPCVSTQVTSVSRKSSMVDEAKSETDTKPVDLSHANGPTQVEYVADYDEVETTKSKKPQGHRRKESTSNFVPTMMWNLSEARTQKVRADITETEEEYGSSKYVYDVTLTEKEVKNDEKKEADDSESYDQALEIHERKVSEGEEVEEFKDYDNNRPQSQISRTDSDSGRRPVSSVFSEDQPDSELSELMKQGSSETEREDPLERPLSPEPEDMENKDITPEFSSEAQASVTELEMEYSGAFSRRDEYASHVSPIREEKSDARFKDSTEEYPEVETVPDGLRSQTSLESTVAEKHELETGEKEILQGKSESGNDIPDITVTQHTPISQQKFQYPEPQEKKTTARTPDTPASSRTSSSSTDQGKEYNLDEEEIRKFPEVLTEEKEVSETKDEKESLDSPSSDSFEMLDKPDITDEFVIIEEVGREAQENDQEGKSIRIASGKRKPQKRVKEEEVKISPPTTTTKMTDLKYFPSEEDPELFPLDSDSPPQPTTRKFVEKLKRRPSKEEKEDVDYEQQIEQNKKWLETQFQGEPAAKIMGGFGYEMEFERAPLEDIKEEDLNELDSSSKIGSMGSQKESLGSFGSVKDSFSSTPDYDVLAGRKYFTKSGDHDDVSMSSLQEFELIEKKLMENGKKSGSSSSQDSLSSKKLGTSSKSGQEDVSSGSLKEFETLENACATVVNMEKKAKQEEAILSEIDEGHESQISESESCETVSAVMREKIELDPEDFDKRMFEIDEIIRQAQSNVEKFSEMQALEKIESIGRGDSYEEVAKVPDLELDLPLPGKSTEISKHGRTLPSYSTQVVTKKKVEEWRAAEKTEQQQTGVTPDKSVRPKPESGKQSELLQNGGKIKSISADSLEIKTAEKQIILEGKEETISLDSYRSKSQKNGYGFPEMTHKSDSMEEMSRHHESSSSGTDPTYRPPPRADFILGSTDSLDPSSSTATHATYQYETDSVMSSSFTSGDSNTMVSSTDNLDLLVSGQSVIDLNELGISRTDDWLENLEVGGANPLEKKLIDQKRSERASFRGPVGERMQEFPKSSGDPRKENPVTGQLPGSAEITDVGPGVQRIVFKGPNAEKALEEYAASLNPEDDVMEVEEVDEHGNVHVKKVLRQRVIVRPNQELTKDELQQYLSRLAESESVEGEGYSHVVQRKIDVPTEIQKVTFKGPDAERQFQEFMQQQQPEIEEIEEVDEHGNVHIKRVLRQRVVVREGRELTKDELEQYLSQLEEPETAEGAISETVIPGGIQKITFTGPDAEKQYIEFMKQQQEPEIEETEEVDEHGNVHIRRVLRQRVIVGPDSKDQLEQYLSQLQEPETVESGSVQKVTFKGPDAEKQFQEFIQQHQEPEVEEIEEVDEYGNVHIKRVLRQRVVVRQDGKQIQQYLSQQQEPETAAGSVQKITFKGPDAEKQFQEFMEQQQEPEIEEIEEVDEHGNVHIKRILRQRVVVRPDSKLTKDELDQYLGQLKETEGETVQKITFKGPDAEKQFQEFMQQQEPEIEEIEEVDEHGNVHIKKVLRQRVVIRQDGKLTKEQLEHYLSQQQGPETATAGVQKITFKGPDAEKQFQEFMQQQEPEIEEIEEVDEHGNVHIKKILRQRVIVRPESKLTGSELEQYLSQLQEPESIDSGSVQKITFKGPDAEKQFQEFMQQQQQEPEVEEIEEIDEHGNVHIKRIIKQRVVVRSGQEGFSQLTEGAKKSSKMLTKDELQQYLDNLGDPDYSEEKSQPSTSGQKLEGVFVQKVVLEPPELADRLLTEEEFQERLKRHQTTVHSENIYIGSTEPFVSEIIEPLDEEGYSHIIHKKMQMAPEVQKVVFRGPHADQALKAYMEALNPGEDFEEVEEVDSDGNVHVKRVLRRKIVLKPEDLEKTGLTGEELKQYLQQFEFEYFEGGEGPRVQHPDPNIPTNQLLTEGFSSSVVLTEKEGRLEETKGESESSSAVRKECGISQRPPLVSDVSMDDEAEYDTTEHDWRHQLEILHAEADEDEIDQNLDAALAGSQAPPKKQ